jgi:phytoene desaturase
MGKKVLIIGAGVGGLATAARLGFKGCEVEVFEKLSRCGGRNNTLEDKGFKFDMGPSFVMMPDFFKELFDYCGERIEDYLDLKVLEKNYKIFYPDGDTLTVYRDSSRTKRELEKFENGASRGFDQFILETKRIYESVEPLLYKCFTPLAALEIKYWPLLAKLNPFQSYYQVARKYFKSEKLLFAFTFEAMFMGVSPYKAPGFYSIITYTDHVDKIRHAMGGMYEIPKAIEKLCKKFGVKFNYDSEVSGINRKGRNLSIKTKLGEISGDDVVVNDDYAYAQENLLKRKIPRYNYSCSVFLLYLGLKIKVSGFEHHNLFFSADLNKNLSQIFTEKVMSEDPSFYVHVPTVTDESLAPPGKEIFYILIPVPNMDNNSIDFSVFEEKIRKKVFSKINKVLGSDLEDLIEVEHKFYPKDFIARYNIKNAATFGLSHNLKQSAFFRPANFDREYKGLYYCGASTQPGGGLPVVIAGSRIVSDLITGVHKS